jgi:Asp-tRNA(Asn)/Glu-tRNA(Gln) amidotransferase A subunit family amidase
MTDLHWLEAHEAAELIATKQLTSLELTGALLNRIEKYDNGLNAFLTLRPDQALEEAKKADEAVQKKKRN